MKKKFVTLGLSLLVAVVLVEILLRVANVGSPVFTRYDEQFGRVLIPDAQGWFTQEGRAWIQINRHGFRDRDRQIAKPDGSFRIAVLGDSYAEALQVDQAETFWSLLEQELVHCQGLGVRNVEVLNFGVSGYSLAQEYLQYESVVSEYTPDIVLLALLTGNDIADSHPGLGGKLRPYFRHEGERLVLDDGFRDESSFRFRTSRAGRALAWGIGESRVLQLANLARIQRRNGRNSEQIGEVGLRSGVYLPEPSGDWAEAWKLSEGILQMMDRRVGEDGARFMVVTLSNGIQVDPDSKVRGAFASTLGVEDLFYPERRLQSFATHNRIPMLNLAPRFLALVEQEPLYLHGWEATGLGRGHWNERGHRLAAELIAPWICGLLSDVSPPGADVTHDSSSGSR